MSIKLLFDEKCSKTDVIDIHNKLKWSLEETQELQELLKQKEADLEKTESLLNNFQQEVQLLSTERKRLIELQNDLELELEISANAHQQLAEQRSENEKLKEIIDTLKTDLDEALLLSNDNEFMIKEIERRQSNASIKVNINTKYLILINDFMMIDIRNRIGSRSKERRWKNELIILVI